MNSQQKQQQTQPEIRRSYIYRMTNKKDGRKEQITVWATTARQARQAAMDAYAGEWQGFILLSVRAERFGSGIFCN